MEIPRSTREQLQTKEYVSKWVAAAVWDQERIVQMGLQSRLRDDGEGMRDESDSAQMTNLDRGEMQRKVRRIES